MIHIYPIKIGEKVYYEVALTAKGLAIHKFKTVWAALEFANAKMQERKPYGLHLYAKSRKIKNDKQD